MVKNTSYKGKQDTVEDVKKAPKERHLTNKYNYCGPGTLYKLRKRGTYEKLMTAAGKTKVGTAPYGRPANKLDVACMAHDKVFGKVKASGNEVRAADKALIKRAQAISGNKSNPIKLRAHAKAVVVGIGGKVIAEKTGLVRKGAFAAGGEKESRLKRGVKKVVKGAVRLAVRKPTSIMKAFMRKKQGDKPNFNESLDTPKPNNIKSIRR